MSWHKKWGNDAVWYLSFLLNKIVNKRVSLSSIFFTMFCHKTLRNACSVTSSMVWERNAHFCSPTPIPEQAKKLKNWWRNEGKKRRNDVSTQMSFLGAQCRHSDILNSSTVSKAIRNMTIPSESLERDLSACKVPTWICSFPTEIFPPQSRHSSHQSLWSPYFLWIISLLLLQISTMSCS